MALSETLFFIGAAIFAMTVAELVVGRSIWNRFDPAQKTSPITIWSGFAISAVSAGAGLLMVLAAHHH
jgi:hypothetical protein